MKGAVTAAAVIALILVLGAAPLVMYQLYRNTLDATVEIDPVAAQKLVQEGRGVLVDVRSAAEFAQGSLAGAVSWPLAVMEESPGPGDLLQEAIRLGEDRELLFICHQGHLSNIAARLLRAAGPARAWSVAGGFERWIPETGAREEIRYGRVMSPEDPGSEGFRRSSSLHQWAAVLAGFAIKPTYSVLALVLIILLIRRRETDLRALRYGLIAFLTGECICAVNYLLYLEQCATLEYLHCYGMVVSFGLVIYAGMEGADRRLLRMSDPAAHCAALRLCRRCIKQEEVPCGLRRLFALLIPCCLVLALFLFCMDPLLISYNTDILGTVYNYSHLLAHQLYEMRFCPLVAVLSYTGASLFLTFRPGPDLFMPKLLFATGSGLFSFGLFRSLLVAAGGMNMVWFNFWEEVTELLFLGAVAWVLWCLRAGLFGKPADGA